MIGTFLLKSIFQNDLSNLDSLVIYQSYIALCEIRFRTVIGIRTVIARIQFAPSPKGGRAERVSGRSIVSGDSAGDLENLAKTDDFLF